MPSFFTYQHWKAASKIDLYQSLPSPDRRDRWQTTRRSTSKRRSSARARSSRPQRPLPSLADLKLNKKNGQFRFHHHIEKPLSSSHCPATDRMKQNLISEGCSIYKLRNIRWEMIWKGLMPQQYFKWGLEAENHAATVVGDELLSAGDASCDRWSRRWKTKNDRANV